MHQITFQTTDNKTFTLTDGWYVDPPVFSFSGGELDSRVRKDLISALQDFVDSKATPLQVAALHKKVEDAVDIGVLTEEERIILHTVGFIQKLTHFKVSEQSAGGDSLKAAPEK